MQKPDQRSQDDSLLAQVTERTNKKHMSYAFLFCFGFFVFMLKVPGEMVNQAVFLLF